MKSRHVLFAALLAAGLLAGCRDAVLTDATAAPGAPAGCSACHQGKRSFAGRDVQELAAAIRAIRDGQLKHPALGLGDDSDAAIDALAEQLVGK